MTVLPSLTLPSALTNAIKILSSVLTSGAIVWQIVDSLQDWPDRFDWVLWLARLVLLAHGVEAIVAIVLARSRKLNPWRYGAYTFFVGTVGLQELARISSDSDRARTEDKTLF